MDFNNLHTDFKQFFDIYKKSKHGFQKAYNNVYFMAFDAEWYQSGDENVVLSYQIATVSSTASNNIIEFVTPRQRLKLAEIVEFGIRSVNGSRIPDDHASARNLVVLISHSTVAEWSVLADRDAPYITTQLTAIRKSPVTSLHPIEIVLGDYLCPCHVQLYDTRLIAPADYQSLKKLSTMLGSADELKVEIGHYQLRRMDRLIMIDYPLYERYALQDSSITLKLFFLLQSTLMELAGHKGKLYRTLASGAVTGFIRKAGNFEAYQAALKSSPFDTSNSLIHLAYHGGRNEGFMVGRSDKIPEINDRIWVDIDFVGCYPTAMALCPTIDCGVNPFGKKTKKSKKNPPPAPVPGVIKHLPVRYKLHEIPDDELLKAGIKRTDYDNTRKILDKITPDIDPKYHAQLMWECNKYLAEMPSIKRTRLLDKAIVFDNTLINAWYKHYKPDSTAVGHLIPGFARIRFAFDMKIVNGVEVKKDAANGDYITLYPCLPVSHKSYGLIYPLSGETYATASEIMLALDAGCIIKAIESLELPVVKDLDSPRRLFFEHLGELTVERIDQKKIIKGTTDPDEKQKAVVLERFIKEFMNSFYGKTAQAINYKKMYDPDTGLMVTLGPSPISEACTSALATGLPRSALSAVLLAIDLYNHNKPHSEAIIVASCTTDGLLVGLPRPEGITAANYYEKIAKIITEPIVAGVGGNETPVNCLEMKKEGIPSVNDMLKQCGCGKLVTLIESYMPIKQMRNSRYELTKGEDNTFLEIKHFADQVVGIKTRGQIGWVNFDSEKLVTIQAKFGLKPPVTDIIQRNAEQRRLDSMDEKKSIKALDDEYDRIMTAGGSVKATLECNWILEQIDRINNGETDVFEYTFYGLKSFNEIIKGNGLDLTQTTSDRIFNADYDWKRKLVQHGDVVSPFSVPHLNLQEMLLHRNQVQKAHSWKDNAPPDKVIQMVALKNCKVNNTGGEAAKMVRLFLYGMFFDYIPGGVKVESCRSKKDNMSKKLAQDVEFVWSQLDFKFEKCRTDTEPRLNKKTNKIITPREPQAGWSESHIKNIVREDKWVANIVFSNTRRIDLLKALCVKFHIDYGVASKRLFTTTDTTNPDKGLKLQVVLALLQAHAHGIEPFKTLYMANTIPPRNELVMAFQPHITESLIASHEHTAFQKGQCQNEDKGKLEKYFNHAGLNRNDAAACVKVLLPVKMDRTSKPRNLSKNKVVQVFAQALMKIASPSVSPAEIVKRLRRYGLNVYDFANRKHSKIELRCIKDTPENTLLIKKLAKVFALGPDPFIDAMIDK